MKFDDIDRKMRAFETAHDHRVAPGAHVVARLDGRGFTRITRETHKFEAPFDPRFRDMMVGTMRHLMDVGFRTIYGFTQSDEISLLFHYDDMSFGRKARKINSVLAGEASAKFSLLLNDMACFDCRVSELPAADLVVDYFRWRSEDAHRNALNAHCYWTLRKEGLGQSDATDLLRGMSVPAKNELLIARGINFNDLPAWHRRGIGAHWETRPTQGLDPRTNQPVIAARRRLRVEFELPVRDSYSDFIRHLICQTGEPEELKLGPVQE